ncbi:MAG: fatty acid desaturase family protein [Parvularculaceae bacterium]
MSPSAAAALAPQPEPRARRADPSTARAPATGEERTRLALERLRPFMAEDEARSARAFWTTWAVTLGGVALAVLVDVLALRILLAPVLGALFARMFVIFHDMDHGAIFRNAPRKRAAMRAFTYAVLSPPSVWKAGHSEHHRETGVFDKFVEGEYPVWSVEKYRAAGPLARFGYRAARHPATIALGYVTAFFIGSCVVFLVRDKGHRWRAATSIALHAAIVLGLAAGFGWAAALWGFVLPAAIAGAIGAYLIYVQHNFPGMRYAAPGARDPLTAATETATFFRMGRIAHWFTANIGFHNVHHLCPRVPFYRLPEATRALYDALPDVKDKIVETSWRWRDVRAAFRANLWDKDAGRMASYAAV